MRNLLLIFLAAVLLSSCSLTKRKYLPGYSLNWGHKAPKTVATKEAIPANHNISPIQPQKITTKELHKPPSPKSSFTSEVKTNFSTTFRAANKIANHLIPLSKEPISFAHTVMPSDTANPKFFTGDEQEDDHSRRSLTYGILSAAIPAFTYIVLYVIALSSGGAFTTSLTIAVGVFLIGVLIGLLFSVLTYIQGIKAIKEINESPDIYTGKGEAIWGMVLASILPILMIVYLIIKR